MAQQFRTNFMPATAGVDKKNQKAQPANRGTSILSLLAGLALLLAAISVAGTYFLGQVALNGIRQKAESLQAAEKQFEPTLIAELKELDERMTIAHDLVRSHRSVTPFFALLRGNTLPAVQFDVFSFDYDEGTGIVEMQGQARTYQAVAQQSEVFGDSRFIDEHLFSNFVLQDTGRVSFDLTVRMSEDIILFEKSIESFRAN